MLYREIIAVCSQIHTKHTNTLCGQNVEFVNIKPDGTVQYSTYSDHWTLEAWIFGREILPERTVAFFCRFK